MAVTLIACTAVLHLSVCLLGVSPCLEIPSILHVVGQVLPFSSQLEGARAPCISRRESGRVYGGKLVYTPLSALIHFGENLPTS